MRNLPVDLQPVETVDVPLPSGSSAALPVCHPTFRRWSGAPVFDYGGKPLLDCDGEACFAELVILRLLLKSGWHGVWVEAFGGTHYLQTMPEAKGPADGLTKPQFGFIEGALACGIPPQALMLVEWSAAA